MTSYSVERFEFYVQCEKSSEWVQLMGHGGPLGSGVLFRFEAGSSESKIAASCTALLIEARHDARKGRLLSYKYGKLLPDEIEPLGVGSIVLGCRAICKCGHVIEFSPNR